MKARIRGRHSATGEIQKRGQRPWLRLGLRVMMSSIVAIGLAFPETVPACRDRFDRQGDLSWSQTTNAPARPAVQETQSLARIPVKLPDPGVLGLPGYR